MIYLHTIKTIWHGIHIHVFYDVVDNKFYSIYDNRGIRIWYVLGDDGREVGCEKFDYSIKKIRFIKNYNHWIGLKEEFIQSYMFNILIKDL